MSGRRRRGDGWDDGHLDAQDERRDPWADSSVDEWGDRSRDPGDDAEWPGGSAAGSGKGGHQGRGAGAGAYVNHAAGGVAAPSFPSFQAASGGGRGYDAGAGQSGGYDSARRGGDRYGAGSGYGSQRGASDGYASAGYNGDANRDAGYGRSAQGAGRRDAAGYDAPTYVRPASPAHAPEFTPADHDASDDEGPIGTPRPYGRLSIYTLHEDKTREFDRLAERAAEGVRTSEPDTLVYVIHIVPKAPMQRIIYEIYRDRAAFLSHERQPHIRQFAADRASCVLATNIIDLRLKYAKVAALGSSSESSPPQQATWTPRTAEAAASNDRYQTQAAQYPAAQYPAAQSQQPATAASFTPAKDRYGTQNAQYQASGRDQYPLTAQYDNSGNAGYGAGDGQYGAANGYSGAAGYANGGSYSSASGYPANGYSAGNGYNSAGGYSGGSGYQTANGYSGANGYTNGYSGAGGYSNGSAYSSGNGYEATAGYAGSGGEAYGAQYTPRYRELTSGGSSDAGGYPDNGGRYGDAGNQSSRSQPSEWAPRPQDQR